MPLKKDEETVLQVQEETFLPSTVQTIDAALTEYIKALKIFCTTNEGWKGVSGYLDLCRKILSNKK